MYVTLNTTRVDYKISWFAIKIVLASTLIPHSQMIKKQNQKPQRIKNQINKYK